MICSCLMVALQNLESGRHTLFEMDAVGAVIINVERPDARISLENARNNRVFQTNVVNEV